MSELANTASARASGDAPPADFARSVNELAAISSTLITSYDELSRRAQRVEQALARANRELAARIDELDRVRGDLEALLEALPIGVIVRDREGRVRRSNRAAQAILGSRIEELCGSTRPLPLEGEPSVDGTHSFIDPEGAPRRLARQSCPVNLPSGEVVGSVELLEDRTVVSALTQRVHLLDKMAGIGTLAAGIAHEIRNPLSAVKGYASLMLRGEPPPEKRRAWAERIVAGASECEGIITNLLSFAAPDRLALEAVDGARLLEEAREQALVAQPGAERWSIELDSDVPAFHADRVKLRQAARNLIANSLHAQPEGGRVRATLRRERDTLVLRVEDAGPGIPAAVRARVLEPFFTTRAEGTGLGMALVHTIARLHGGGVEISHSASSLGGADIRVTLPYQPAA